MWKIFLAVSLTAQLASTVNAAAGCAIIVNGTPNNDVLDGRGQTVSECMYGYAGDDQLLGGSGGNLLDGGPGQDYMVGGAGDNTFEYDYYTDSVPDIPDQITDFKVSGDVLDISGACGNAGVTCRLVNKFTCVPGQIIQQRVEIYKNGYDYYQTWVFGDFTGSCSADFKVVLDGLLILTNANFVF